jgi:hypothetical protein
MILILLFIIIYYYLLLFIIIYHYLLLFIIIVEKEKDQIEAMGGMGGFPWEASSPVRDKSHRGGKNKSLGGSLPCLL